MPSAPLPRSARSRRTTDSPISDFIRKALETPGLISFAAGLVDEDSLPTAEVAAAAAAVLGDPATGRAALQYGSTAGLLRLRQQVLDHVCSADGVCPAELNLTADDVVLGTGSQQLLYLLAELLLDPGDIVITEAPSYFVFHSLLRTQGVRVLGVPLDEQGLRTDRLAALLALLDRQGELERVKIVYTVDYFQNPTGRTLSLDRRRELVELVRGYGSRHRILVVEDAAYRELRYAGPDLPSLKRFDPENESVVYTGTFSKSGAPGLKTGYVLAPPDVTAPLLHLKGSHDFGSSNLTQHLLSRLIADGSYAHQIETLRVVYRRKRDLVLKALAREFGDFPGATWTEPAGGLYVWLGLEGWDTGPHGPFARAALEAGVLYVPGEFCYAPDTDDEMPRHYCRLCFGVVREDEIAEGIRRLRQAVEIARADRPSLPLTVAD